MPNRSASDPVTLDPATVERFRRDVLAITGEAPTPNRTLGLAVSGGADSMAMLVLAASAFPGRIAAATVDHRLRSEAAEEAAMVADHCRTLGVPHATLVVDRPIGGASVQAQARDVRYALLRGWVAEAEMGALATAHHADDQAETFLMRAARGSGVGGLAGIRVRQEMRFSMDDGIPLIRPLLGWRRVDLRGIAQAAGVPFADDPSNLDPVYDRTRFRQLIEHNAELDVLGIAASAAYAAEAEETLGEIAQREWIVRRQWDQQAVAFDAAGLPRGLRRRLARYAIEAVRGDHAITEPAWSDTANVEHLLDALDAGRGATKAGVMAKVKEGYWHFVPAPPRRSH
ncbi:MAG: tRNA lysidine(34) synthetase TilS [Sphingomonadales bacterium]|nr:MAG: tRNA lysidine(34) synthetase TilS [Sphingomonadales bacterium]